MNDTDDTTDTTDSSAFEEAVWVQVPVTDLMDILDPQYRIEGLHDDGEVDPNWGKVERFAAMMRAGTFDHDAEAITVVTNGTESMVFDGNHRVLAADLAGIASLSVGYTSRPLG